MTDEQDPHSLKDTVLAHYSQKRRRQPNFSDPLSLNATESSGNHEDHAVDGKLCFLSAEIFERTETGRKTKNSTGTRTRDHRRSSPRD
ncbi:hypothetical protein L596_000748 [Steinernema carpocapsae]|uniref:Uncharacterized protein n=1 Tax=Steinernema carpocapsae TaxID=34508 RepID=A0A4V6I770_STECR|nr:hypothetical protein L596_000748 [Steinernema carpocapsae]